MTRSGLNLLPGCIVLLGSLFAGFVEAQDFPLYVASKYVIEDEDDQPLRGLDPAGEALGLPREKGAVVQILGASAGIFPPNADGSPNLQNPLLGTTRTGIGAALSLSARGRFGATVVPRPTTPVFVRVFNGPELALATRYGDSQTFVSVDNTPFLADIEETGAAFATDSDGDGLNNYYEGLLGSNANLTDSDGDGVADGDEYRAGSGIANPSSFLGITTLKKEPSGLWTIGWESSTGRTYCVEYSGIGLCQGPIYSMVCPMVTATSATTTVQASIPGSGGDGHFRVRLME